MINLQLLSPERFQHLAQALLLDEYPGLQCLPTGQPDGGRDGLASVSDLPSEDSTVVVQVKYRTEERLSTYDWIVKAFTPEIEKATELQRRGVSKYVVATNAHVSTHLDRGEFDRVNAWFRDNFPLPVITYYREDFERRFERAPVSLKLEYPSVLTGEHAVLMLLQLGTNADLARVHRAFVAAASTQWEEDSRVRFQQVELDATLASIFVDLPFRFHGGGKALSAQMDDYDAVDDYWTTPADQAGIAEALLTQSGGNLQSVYLEGGPGQGKSTVTQYVAQVHRAKLLAYEDFLSSIGDTNSQAPFRVPLRVDFRKFASWVRSAAGFGTLEEYLAEEVTRASGGQSVDVTSLTAFIQEYAACLLFDALDEVADLDLRFDLVDRVTAGVARFRAMGGDVQVIIASRPSVLSMPVHFKRIDALTIRLVALKAPDVMAYARTWAIARALPNQEYEVVSSALLRLITQPHVAELTRSPMQLAIFLSLLLTKGEALPELRTELYRDYVSLFMAREALKDDTVRRHQKLIIQIVQFVAYTLQADAEANNGSGAISGDALRALILKYLEHSGNDTSLIDELFNFGLERIYVLTHRMEGLYEFEVQPLREYFAAEHLYSTAPGFSIRLDDPRGDKSQRFEALAQRPYWFNTLRFYGGFYTGGEVGAIAASLLVLADSESYQKILARGAGVALLQDWVFRVKIPVQDMVIDLVSDGLGVTLAEAGALVGADIPTLHPECGRDRFRNHIFRVRFRDQLSRDVDFRSFLLLRRNGGDSFDYAPWVSAVHQDRFGRLVLARALKGDINYLADVEAALEREGEASRAQVLLQACDHVPGLARKMAGNDLPRAIMQEGPTFAPVRLADAAGVVNALAGGLPSFNTLGEGSVSRRLAEVGARLRARRDFDAYVDLDARIGVLREEFGDCFGLLTSAFSGLARVRIEEAEIPTELTDLVFDEIRNCLELASSPTRWLESLKQLSSDGQLGWVIALLAFRAELLPRHVGHLEAVLSEMSEAQFRRLHRGIHAARRLRRRRKEPFQVEIVASERLAGLIEVLATPSEVARLAERFGAGSVVGQSVRRRLALRWLAGFAGWGRGMDDECLDRLREVGARSRNEWSFRRVPLRLISGMPVDVAEKVLNDALEYPIEVIREAGAAIISAQESSSKSVMEIADEEHWELV